jgi:hypothetical protein
VPNSDYMLGVLGQSNQLCNVHHDLQTGLESGVVMLQVKGCILLWPESLNLGLQLSQHHNVVVRVDGLHRFALMI